MFTDKRPIASPKVNCLCSSRTGMCGHPTSPRRNWTPADSQPETQNPAAHRTLSPGAPRLILDSRRTRFSRLLATFDAPFRDIAFEHGENLAIAHDIQNSQSRGSPADDLYNRGRWKDGSHPIALLSRAVAITGSRSLKRLPISMRLHPFLHYVVGRSLTRILVTSHKLGGGAPL